MSDCNSVRAVESIAQSQAEATLDDVVTLLREIADGIASPPSPLLSREAFARLLDVGVSTFDRLRDMGEIGPRPVRIGGQLRWHREEVLSWLRRRTTKGELFDSTAWPAVWRAASSH